MTNGAVYEFGPFRLDGDQLVLMRDGQPLAIPPKDFDVLLVLVKNGGRLVTKEQLFAEVWPGSVIEEGNLARRIFNLRQLLGDGSENTQYIETVPRRGYRFVGQLSARSSVTDTNPRLDTLPHAKQHRRPLLIAAIATVVAVLITATITFNHRHASDERRASLEKALSEVATLVGHDDYGAAFKIAYPWMHTATVDPEMTKLWRRLVLRSKPLLVEEGATVYFKPYADVNGPWIKGGISPFSEPVDMPRGPLRLKIEKQGFQTAYLVVANPGPSLETKPYSGERPGMNPRAPPLPLKLVRDGELPPNMTLVPGTDVPVILIGWATNTYALGERHKIPDFAIMRTEVSNREFKEFVDAGGYDNPEYWQGLAFVDGKKKLTWAEARAQFVDRTNRPGPSGWQMSTYPDEQAAYPVGGVSWYEAVAYARFRGLQLPTVHHWVRAAFSVDDEQFPLGPTIAASSRIQSSGPVPANQEQGLGPWGTIHTAGNVREWVWNFADGKALALGGAWADPYSEYQDAYTAQPFNRSLEHGIRLMKSLHDSAIPERLLDPIHLVFDEPRALREPVSDEAFESMRVQFTAISRTPVKVEVREIDAAEMRTAKELRIVEEIRIEFPKGEPLNLYVIRPRHAKGRLQAVLYAPGADCCDRRMANEETLKRLPSHIFLGGRALIVPIWQGSFERFLGPPSPDQKATNDRQRRIATEWYEDLITTLDYIHSRDDIDSERIAFLGISRGAATVAVIAAAVEPRIKTVIFESGGIVHHYRVHPMIDAINYAPRIKIPALMVNGRLDHLFHYERSQKRFFNLLGTPDDQKKHIVLETGHNTRTMYNVNATVIADWLDRYLGPTK